MIGRDDLSKESQGVVDGGSEMQPISFILPELPISVLSDFRQAVLDGGNVANLLFENFRTTTGFNVNDFIVETSDIFSQILEAEETEDERYLASSPKAEKQPAAMIKGMLLGWAVGLEWLEDYELDYLSEAKDFVDEELYAIHETSGHDDEDQVAWRGLVAAYGQDNFAGFGMATECLRHYLKELEPSDGLQPLVRSGAG